MKVIHKTVRVTQEQSTRIKELADLHGVSEAQIVRAVLQRGLNELYDLEKTGRYVQSVDAISAVIAEPEEKDSGYTIAGEALKAALKREAKLQRIINELKENGEEA